MRYLLAALPLTDIHAEQTARCATRSVSVQSTRDFQLKHLIENQYLFPFRAPSTEGGRIMAIGGAFFENFIWHKNTPIRIRG